jgi:hypothetical protein
VRTTSIAEVMENCGQIRHHFASSRSRRRELKLGERRPWASKITSARACTRLITDVRRDGFWSTSSGIIKSEIPRPSFSLFQ